MGKRRCVKCIEKRKTCITLLIDAGAEEDAEDKLGNTPLYYCAINLQSECAKTLLDFEASLSKTHSNSSQTVAVKLAEYLPETLCHALDNCINYHSSNKLQVNFQLLLDDNEDDNVEGLGLLLEDDVDGKGCTASPMETYLLQCVLKARNGYENVVIHPVVQVFLHYKWLAVRRIFLFLRSFFFILLVLYSWVIVRVYSDKCMNDVFVGGEGNMCKGEKVEEDSVYQIVAMVLIGGIALMALIEVYKMCSDPSDYFATGKTWGANGGILWWTLYILWAATLVPAFGPKPLYYHYPIAAISLVYSWIMIVLQMGRMPWFALHVGLFVEVVTDFVRLLVTFSAILVAFTLGFWILLPENPNFTSLPFSIFKVFMMMKGDIDYEGILNHETNPFLKYPMYTALAHMLYTVFVIVVTMVLTALLIGLAVSDIEHAKQKASVNLNIRLIKEIGILEGFIRGKLCPRSLSVFLEKYYSIERNYHVKGSKIIFSPVHPDDRTLPPSLKTLFLEFYNKMSTNCRRTRRRRNKQKSQKQDQF